MLSANTRKIIKNRKFGSHSNKSQFFARIREESKSAFDDLTLLAKKLDEKQLQEIFTKQNLEKLFIAIMEPSWTSQNKRPSKEERDRIFNLGFMFVDSSVGIIEHTLNDVYAQRLYARDKEQFMKTLKLMYFDKKTHKL